MRDSELLWTDVRGQKLFLSYLHLDRLHLELFSTVFRERPDKGIKADVCLRPVQSGYFNEDVFGVD